MTFQPAPPQASLRQILSTLDAVRRGLSNNYYTKTETDSRFANVSGDTFSGDVTVQGALLNSGFRACVARRTSDGGSIVDSSSSAKVPFGTVDYNTEGSAFDAAGANSDGAHFTVPTGVTLIRVTAGVVVNAAAPVKVIFIRRNGNAVARQDIRDATNDAGEPQASTGLLPVTANDTITITCFQNSGAAQQAGSDSTFISIEIVG